MSTIPSRSAERQRRPSRTEVRDRLLDAARREFAARGFDGVSLDRVAAAAGFSKGAVYSNFASKYDLILALMDESVTARMDIARGVASSEQDSSVARQLGDRLIAAFADDLDWQLLFTEFWLRAMRDPEVREPFLEYRRRFRRSIAAEFERVFPDGDAELAAVEVATAILALINGLAIERFLDPESASEALLGIALERLLRPAS